MDIMKNKFLKQFQKLLNLINLLLISCKTIIGFGSPNKSGKASSHGSPLGDEEIALVRKKLKWNYKPFEIPQEILDAWKEIGRKGEELEKKWQEVIDKKNSKMKMI